ncbi:hypothetical protein BKD09_16240 [Bradyrhizobium japonicum]|uniref:Uncharacterized protein n=1 Tax=Bradyrhizobium japonicum TaxID=375 RepID=A0A1L3F9G3_BRAJP|nr:hypothetical protein BKD09_16240 [Bradyrhizobium japonicum]
MVIAFGQRLPGSAMEGCLVIAIVLGLAKGDATSSEQFALQRREISHCGAPSRCVHCVCMRENCFSMK